MRPITDTELAQFQRFIFDEAGITMSAAKKALVMGRLGKRLAAHELENFGEYFRLLTSGQHPAEVQMAVDLLTTNETYFFREIKHFEFLRTQALAARNRSQSRVRMHMGSNHHINLILSYNFVKNMEMIRSIASIM